MKKMKFLIKISDELSHKIHEKFKDSDDLYLITEWGAVGKQEKAKYVLEWGEKSGDNWFGDISFLEISEDGCFVRLKKKKYKDKLPNVKDIFSFKTYYPDGTIITEEPKEKEL